ncbi:NAD-dependent epimerase/dehydratase family protein [Microbacterium protaetiae]|uniref:NAD-dependent epimerase/dehydratase family protein n=1 Tax=Microbacterium protaetiae TaxID=2509458 RepID=A0A4P6E9X5_9MICO|nr:NAD(P)H-binding protein [Microbacterium protaetiae]QAY58754.1 NAD-dependent epimerase/dehydratase family protein [Microbacterium protaetiae]
MARIVVIGGTGYAGGHIVAEAAARGHDVVSVARKAPDEKVDAVTYVQGDLRDLKSLSEVLEGADAVVDAVSPRGDMVDAAVDALRALAAKLTGTNTRLGVVGGAMGSLAAPGGPRLYDLGVPPEFGVEPKVGVDSLELLQASDEGLDWFLVHPPKEFGAWVPGERTGHYRDGGDVVVEDADGKSFISGADFAIAVVDEIEQGRHHRARFTVGY